MAGIEKKEQFLAVYSETAKTVNAIYAITFHMETGLHDIWNNGIKRNQRRVNALKCLTCFG
ncbi:hypothetical protein [Agrobacterium tumefaciens]|uniref:hypothetical protein n=1 Tax=Agrobacterium tumefaciens TaxID=358 RepID=UPI002AFE33F3|nr:hypothetical protein [Agrobacterium tumefaciens]MEA1844742.1 hypothetical protein [Agrobacterium tumefaciens]